MTRIIKVLVASCLLLLVTPSLAKAQSKMHQYARSSRSAEAQNVKAGLQVEALASLTFKAFGEYKFYEQLGVRAALAYDYFNWYILQGLKVPAYNGKDAIVVLSSINLPVTVRLYPGEDRQACWFLGIQPGYIVDSGAVVLLNRKSFELSEVQEIREKKGNGVIDLEKISDQVTKFRFGILLGFDYESSFGLSFGISCNNDFISMLEADDSFVNWNFRPTLGYNFAKLFE